jgi:hypothetical protein
VPDHVVPFAGGLVGNRPPRLVAFPLRIRKTMVEVGQPLFQLGGTLDHRVLDVVHLRVRDPPRVFDIGLGSEADLGQLTLEIGDLLVARAAYLVGVALGGVADIGELRMRLLPDGGGCRLGGLSHRTGPIVRGCPKRVVRERAEIRFEMSPGARNCAVERLPDAVVERHSRIIGRSSG